MDKKKIEFITVVSSGDFGASPAQYLTNVSERPVEIVAPSGARLTIMGSVDLNEPDPFDTAVRANRESGN